LTDRACNSLMLFRALAEIKGVNIKTHSTVLYNSIYLTENKILINQHTYGLPAAKSPAIDVNRKHSPEMEEVYLESFNKVWENESIQYNFWY